jgi:hypothetical protein
MFVDLVIDLNDSGKSVVVIPNIQVLEGSCQGMDSSSGIATSEIAVLLLSPAHVRTIMTLLHDGATFRCKGAQPR